MARCLTEERIPGWLERREQVRNSDAPPSVLFLGQGADAILHERGPKGLLLPREAGKFGQMTDDMRGKIAFEDGQELAANARTLTAKIAIRGILAPRLAEAIEILPEVLPAHAEKRPDDGTGEGINSRETRGAGSAKHVREHGFGLVIGCVSHGDARCTALGGEALEEGIAKAPGGILKIPAVARGSGGDLLARDDEFKPARVRQLGDKSRMRVRLRAAQGMIEVGDKQRDSQRVAEAFQQEQKRSRVRTAGYGDGDAVAGDHHPGGANGFKDFLFERRFHWPANSLP